KNVKNMIWVLTQRLRLDKNNRLYDMQNDFGQRTDVSQKFPAEKKRLKAAAEKYRTEVLSELPQKDQRPFVIAHPGHEYTQMPARDAYGVGGVKRSCKHPNCSYYTNWTQTADCICWDVDVVKSGRFEVMLYYTCPAKDIGSSVTLSCGDSSLKFKISEAHDSPLIGAEADRIPRWESYVKDWKKISIGEINLTAGKACLKMQATDIPGSQVMEFRLLLFKRVDHIM
ncbi:MAG: N-acetylgalactosamine 6-sulfate sulfatase, partial [Kiritimatiellae bacterium]|nr:N-acetylgalactosamine 6-sulfate sulfatase [Kiritimatiellia bacterium]